MQSNNNNKSQEQLVDRIYKDRNSFFATEVSCLVLQDPPNGRVSLSGTSMGSEASYSCDSGFTLVGSRVRVCQAEGEWSSEEPFCQGKGLPILSLFLFTKKFNY